tara:strand:+ start:475 stop:684 length:210 start_codon:yes stop_codon:yes gene_type:complete
MAVIEDPVKKIELLEEDIRTWKNLRGSEVAMNKDLKDKIKKLELALETVIGINETLLHRIIKLQDLLLK